MKLFSTLLLSICLSGAVCAGPSTLDIPLKDIDGKKASLGDHKGKVMLVVNVASKCGLTPQYKQLQAVHSKFAKRGFTVLGFPCNQFGKQEPGSPLEIKKFCSDNYEILKKESGGSDKIRWNFEKFLLDGNGKVLKRFSPPTKPDAPEVIAAIESALKK